MALMAVLAAGAKDPVLAPSYAWMLIEPLGLRKPTTIDTIYLNYARESVLIPRCRTHGPPPETLAQRG